MKIKEHTKVTGFSGNEIFCLKKIGCNPGQLCFGNNVVSLGVIKGLGSILSNLAGGEVEEITNLVHEGRKNALNRMMQEAKHYGGIGLAAASFDLINHAGNLEFIAFGSTIRKPVQDVEKLTFSTSANAQELYCQIDAGFNPRSFVFSNVAYSIGIGGNIKGMFRSLGRGEVSDYTEIFDHTRHLALTRIKNEAKALKANAVIGIKTSIIPLLGTQEMMMTGTASVHPALNEYSQDPVTSDMTNEEMWNLVNIGYLPISLVMGVSVYSLGVASGIMSFAKSLVGGQIDNLTELLYEAREKAFARIEEDAEKCNADEVVGVKTRVYDLGGGLVEVMVIGTAVKKIEGITTRTPNLPPQAIIKDEETFIDEVQGSGYLSSLYDKRILSATDTQIGPIKFIVSFIVLLIYIIAEYMK